MMQSFFVFLLLVFYAFGNSLFIREDDAELGFVPTVVTHVDTRVIKRNRAVVRKFLKLLGHTATPPGAQVDHIMPLSCGGKDEIDNLQLTWGAYKDQKERAERNCGTIGEWVASHPCASGECVKPVVRDQ